MSGRRQAATTAVLLGLIPIVNLLSAAIVALVTLRKGPQEGLLVLLWALLPAALRWLNGDTTVVFALLAAVPLAWLLRRSASWPQVIVAIVALGIGLQLSLALQPGYVAMIHEGMALLLDMMQQQGSTPQLVQDGQLVPATAEQLAALLLSFYGAYHALVSVAVLIVARFYQAMLYNPGGFRAEFHALRPNPRMMLALLVLVLAGLAGAAGLEDWVTLFCLAPILTGLAVIHALVTDRNASGGWLILAYLLLIFAPPIIVVLGFADSVADFRQRYKR
ncbi:MAG TPA: hypothetical protein VNR18_05375 [Hyphomicrobiales bacterium]|nr:hypothetical protein [Hyphomicrobiales bacterium]